jgi:hypothetical protein
MTENVSGACDYASSFFGVARKEDCSYHHLTVGETKGISAMLGGSLK